MSRAPTGEIRCAECGVLLSTTALSDDDRPVYCYRHWKAHQRLCTLRPPTRASTTTKKDSNRKWWNDENKIARGWPNAPAEEREAFIVNDLVSLAREIRADMGSLTINASRSSAGALA